MGRIGLGLLAGLLWGAAARAEDAPTAEDLARRNAELERRVRALEESALQETIEEYLADSRTEVAAEGAQGLLPGGLGLRISGQVRIRGEVQDHLYSPAASPTANPDGSRSFEFAHMRTRLRFDVDVAENLGVVIELQDIRNFGEEGSTTGDLQGVDVKRAQILFHNVFGRPVTAEVGRFVMHYGDHRIIGDLEWFDQGRSYDGARLSYSTDRGFLDFFAVKVRETVFPADDRHFLGLYGGLTRETVTVEGYVIWLADQRAAMGEVASDDTSFVTLGTRFQGSRGALGSVIEAAVQTGGVRGDDLTAWAIVARGTCTFEDARWRPRILVEIAFATGNEAPGDGDTEQFQVLFPTNHLHYGYADLAAWSNIFNVRAGVSLTPREHWTVTIDFHHLQLADEDGGWVNAGGATIQPGAPGADTDLGTEIDLTVAHKPSKSLAFLFGWSVFFPGGFVEDTGRALTAQFIYLQVHTRF
ncbi:MAG: alginate export family protein [Planctomycetota bacterium]